MVIGAKPTTGALSLWRLTEVAAFRLWPLQVTNLFGRHLTTPHPQRMARSCDSFSCVPQDRIGTEVLSGLSFQQRVSTEVYALCWWWQSLTEVNDATGLLGDTTSDRSLISFAGRAS